MRNMPCVFTMTPMGIPDPALLKRKVFLAQDAGDDHQIN
jgi:hypothetical protein